MGIFGDNGAAVTLSLVLGSQGWPDGREQDGSHNLE